MSVSGIDWAYLGSIGGEGIEAFAAACLRQRYPDAIQVNPGQGDGGIDIYRQTDDGLVVWQIKRFTTPVASGQKNQIRRSWKRFWSDHVEQGEQVAQYYLATPWTATEAAWRWFRDLTSDAEFPCQWDGGAFFDGLASDYPATFDRFFKGPDMLEKMVLAKAGLASSPVEVGDTLTMLEAIGRREDTLRELRDIASDTYFIDSATVTTRDGAYPLPGPNDAAIVQRYTPLGNSRFKVESIVPKTAQSLELDPISVEFELIPDEGSDGEKKADDWEYWGVPLDNVPAFIRPVGGPFHQDAPSASLLSTVLHVDQRHHRDIEVRIRRPDGQLRSSVRLRVKEVTHGRTGGGIRVVGSSPGGAWRLELRGGSTLRPGTRELAVTPQAGDRPDHVSDDLATLMALEPDDTFEVAAWQGPVLAHDTGVVPPEATSFINEIATALRDLQAHSVQTFLMPDVAEVTPSQLANLRQLAEVYRGNAVRIEWATMTMTFVEDAGLDPSVLDRGYLCRTEQPVFHLGSSEYVVTRRMTRMVASPRLSPGTDPAVFRNGGRAVLVPGDDPQMIISFLAWDTIDGTAPVGKQPDDAGE